MKENVVQIKGGKYRYQYDPETGKTLYRGPVGDAPSISEQDFFNHLDNGWLDKLQEPGSIGITSEIWDFIRFDRMHVQVTQVLKGQTEWASRRIPDNWKVIFEDENLTKAGEGYYKDEFEVTANFKIYDDKGIHVADGKIEAEGMGSTLDNTLIMITKVETPENYQIRKKALLQGDHIQDVNAVDLRQEDTPDLFVLV
jgi:hypothetical protein